MSNKKTTLIVVRHAQSEGNYGRFFAGHTDVCLTELGHRQAKATADFLLPQHIDIAYSSDLSRVIQTGKYIADSHGLNLILDKGLREIYGGNYEGLSISEIYKTFPKEREIWDTDFYRAECPGGESVQELFSRVKPVFDRIAEENIGKTVLVCTHAAVIRVMSTAFWGKSLETVSQTPWVDNASATFVEYLGDGRWSMIDFNHHQQTIENGSYFNIHKTDITEREKIS